MPNWCSNSGTISGPKEKIDKLEAFLDERKGENWFDFFKPTPKELEENGWYEWNVSNWGTKWNATADWHREDDETIHLNFDTAWAPPTQLYETIEEEGYSVSMQYLEEGMGFVGEFIDGEDNYYEYSDLDSLDDIPEHLVDNWGLRDMMEGWEDEEEYEEYDSDKTTLDDLQKEFDELSKKEG